MLTAAAIEDEGAAALRSHGRTFHVAHRLLGSRAARGVHLLYGFCRYVDDAVDEATPEEGARALAAIRADLTRGHSDVEALQGYMLFRERHGVDDRITQEFLRGVEQDLHVTVYRTQRELDRYCYRVAGTVGLLMCALFGVDDPRALPFAVDLGLGMQLTNICRDVLEDAERGRVYLPQSVLGVDVTAERLAAREPDALARARTVVEDLLERAECFYRSADLGTPMLPARARYAVLAASRTYEAIGARIRRFPAGGLPERAYVGASGKALHVLRGVAAGALPRRGSPVHDATLHTALRGLPGADPG